MKSHIEKNTALRMKAKNSFEKDFFKLLNNSVFGKTMENIRKRVDIRLLNEEKQARKMACRPNFKHLTIFAENLAAVYLQRTKLVFDKPVYVGMAILDLSKTLMYDFHSNYAKKKWKDLKLLFTDTDSLLYEIGTEDIFRDISEDVETMYDTSDFPKEGHPSGIPVGNNKKVIGLMKDEAAGKNIVEFVGLRPKLYSLKMEEGKE